MIYHVYLNYNLIIQIVSNKKDLIKWEIVILVEWLYVISSKNH